MLQRLGVRTPIIRSFAIFVASLLVCFTLLRTSIMQELIGHPLAIAFTSIGGFVLNLLSFEATTSGTILRIEGFAAEIDDVCTGIFVVAIYLSAVLAYPSRTKEKLKGLALGASVILSLNLIRIVSLMFIGRYFPTLFEAAHLLVWQSLIIFFALLVWLYWTARFVSAPQH